MDGAQQSSFKAATHNSIIRIRRCLDSGNPTASNRMSTITRKLLQASGMLAVG